MNRAVLKVLVFVALLILLFTLEGFVPPPGAFSFGRHSPPWLIFTLLYVYGAYFAVWGNRTVGMLHPTSYRWVYVTGGALLMLLILSLILYGRGHASHLPNKPDAVNPGVMIRLTIKDQRRRVTDLERSALPS